MDGLWTTVLPAFYQYTRVFNETYTKGCDYVNTHPTLFKDALLFVLAIIVLVPLMWRLTKAVAAVLSMTVQAGLIAIAIAIGWQFMRLHHGLEHMS